MTAEIGFGVSVLTAAIRSRAFEGVTCESTSTTSSSFTITRALLLNTGAVVWAR